MTDEEMAKEYVYKHTNYTNYTIVKRENGTEYAKAVNNVTIEEAFIDGLKAGRPKWHKVAGGDLPKHEVNVLVLHSVQCIDIAHYNYDYKEWHFADSIVRDVIAWCEIPKYTEE